MIDIFSENWDNLCKSYKTERFCALVDHNVILSIETRNDGSEHKICHNLNACKKKEQCRYFTIPKSNKLNCI